MLGVGLAMAGFFCALLCRKWPVVQAICLCCGLIFLGFAAASWSTQRAIAPVLAEKTGIIDVAGRVLDSKLRERGNKVILGDVAIEGLAPEKTPHKVTLSLKFYDTIIPVGEHVHLRAGLMPPSRPVLPGAFDFSRHYFFKQIGANGYGIPPLVREGGLTQAESDTRVARWQQAITQRISEGMRAPEGAVATALITGITSAIPDDVTEHMRSAGLYHLLAVSGMNLAVVVGVFFIGARWVLVLIPGFALRFSIKKWAAVAALIGSYAYLKIAGSPISAERAFYMAALLLMAVLLDRVVTPVRSLMWAAVVILLVAPEALLGASFQLSFAATLALVSFYEAYGKRFALPASLNWHYRALYFILGIFFSSLVAGLATLPFLIYHFNTMATYSLLANMLVIPLVSLWIMPWGVLGVLLLPLGLEGLGFYPMQWGITLMLFVGEWVSGFSHASIRLPSFTNAGLGLFALGGLWLCLWSQRVRWLGVVPMLCGLATITQFSAPDILISENMKQQAIYLPSGKLVLIAGRKSDFVVKEWQNQLAVEDVLLPRDVESTELTCDDSACIYRKDGQVASFLKQVDAREEDCATAQLVISRNVMLDGCAAPIRITPEMASKEGAHAIWLTKAGMQVKTVRGELGNRPWVRDAEATEPPE